MMPLTFGQAAAWGGAELWLAEAQRPVRGVVIDSRQAGPDTLFVALPGTRTDGHRFVREVWRAGATALVQAGFLDRGGPLLVADDPLTSLGEMMRRYIIANGIAVVGITGSVGKTSVKELCHAVLATKFVTARSLGNYNTAIGLPLSFFAAPPDTTHFVAEMGMSAPGEIRQMTAIAPPAVAVITTIGPSHLERLGSMQAIARAKGEILEGLVAGGTAILNHDDARVRELGQRLGLPRVRWYGRHPGVDAVIEEARLDGNATLMTLRTEDGRLSIRLPWLGVHQADNVAAAVLTGQVFGIEGETMLRGLETVPTEASRIRVYQAGLVTILEDAYNSSPASAKAALEVLAVRSGRRVAVLGDMLELGEAEENGHREIGAYCAGRADWVVGVGQRARWLVDEALRNRLAAVWLAARDEARALLEAELRPGDTVLIKASRGMALEQIGADLRRWGGPG